MVRTLASIINPQGIVARKLHKVQPMNSKCAITDKRKVSFRNIGNRYKKQPIPKWQKKITLFFEHINMADNADFSVNSNVDVNISRNKSNVERDN